MAISIFCYTSKDIEEASALVDDKISKLSYFSSGDFLVSQIFRVSRTEKEIAAEYEFNAKNLFLVTLNKKDKANEIQELFKIIKEIFGSRSILLLLENEKVI